MIVSTPVDQGVNRCFSPGPPHPVLRLHVARQERSRECRGRTMGLPFARQAPEKNKPEFEIPAQGAGPGWVLPRGVGGEKPPTFPGGKEIILCEEPV